MPFIKPTYNIDGDVTDIIIETLVADGIRGLIFDLDSTLMESKSGRLTDEVSAWLIKARPHFKMVILSNNKNTAYLEKVKALFDMPVIGYAKKPSRRGFRKAIEMLGLTPTEVAVIGDRPLTDILGGHRSGAKTVLVKILRTINEPSWKTSIRNLERRLIGR
ncbi:MAG: YqeG family HAD IIIA-type phosphatase [Candidatus Melainabacteria bacterium]|nr:MAG: YqeG family HAD IIIA-type phosphatase [Candidatus Melainabacteria bacterium]